MAIKLGRQLKFKNPPINEIIFGVGLTSDNNFNATVYGSFYNQIKDEYTKVSNQIPLSLPGEDLHTKKITNPRVWFETTDKLKLIQVQSDCFYYNWRKMGDKVYPGYKDIYDSFKSGWKKYSTLLKKEYSFNEPIATFFELSYINHIHGIDDDRIGEMVNLFSNSAVDEKGIMKSLNLSFSSEDGSVLTCFLGPGNIMNNTNDSVLIFELRVSKNLDDNNRNFDDWFGKAHDRITKAFSNSLSEKALLGWGHTT